MEHGARKVIAGGLEISMSSDQTCVVTVVKNKQAPAALVGYGRE